MRSGVKIGAALAAAAAVSLLHAQNAVLDAQSEGRAGAMQFNPKELTVKKDVPAAGPLPLTPLDRPLAREPGKIEVPNVKAPSAPSAGYDGQPVTTYTLTNSWPKKVESAPPKPAVLAPSAPQQGRVNKIDAITIKQGVAR